MSFSVCIHLRLREKWNKTVFSLYFAFAVVLLSKKKKTQCKRKKMCLVWRGCRNRTHVSEMVCEVVLVIFSRSLKWIQRFY